MSSFKELETILSEMENELKNLGLWDVPEPATEAFKSESPFYLDTMSFNEWLHYVLIRRLRDVIAASGKLPGKVRIFPYAYEYYNEDRSRYMGLLRSIHRLDSFFERTAASS